jgi:LuxR family maltose regulon positive regulatory protein
MLDTSQPLPFPQIEEEGGTYESPDGEGGSWRVPLARALASASRFSSVQPIATFGIAALPLPQESDWNEDQKFLVRTIAFSRQQATFYPTFAQPPVKLERPLTPTEEKVLRLIAAYLSNAAIGEIPGIKLPTVKAHVSHIMQKLGVTTRAKAKAAARKLGLV